MLQADAKQDVAPLQRLRTWLWPEGAPTPGQLTDSMSAQAWLHDQRWLRLLWLFGIATVVTAVSMPYLPMADLPQHAAQVGMLRHFEHYAGEYQINWFTPYLLGYGSAYLLSWVVGVSAAIRLVVALSLAAFAITSAMLLRQVGARPGWALLVVPGLFGFTYDWGFLNFLVAAPLLLGAMIFALRWAQLPRLNAWQVLSIIACAQLLFMSHVLAYALAGLLAATIFLTQGPHWFKRCLRVAYFGTAVPVALWWMTRTHDAEPQVQESIYFNLTWARLGYLGSDIVGLEAGGIYATLGWLALLLPWFQGARFAKPVYRWLPLVLVTAIYLLGPTRAFGTHFIANRFTYFIMPFYLFALSPRQSAHAQRLAPMTVAAALTTLCFGFWARDTYRFGLESAPYAAIRQAIEPGKKALYMPFASMSPYSPAPAYLHFASYYTAEKLGDVDFNFSQFFPEMVRNQDPRSRPIGAGFSFAPGHFDWRLHRGDNYDYFIVRSPGDAKHIILKHAPNRHLTLVTKQHWWWLYKKELGPPPVAEK